MVKWASNPIRFTYRMRNVPKGKHIEWDWARHKSFKEMDKLHKPDVAARVIRVAARVIRVAARVIRMFAAQFPLSRSADITKCREDS